MEFSSSRPFRSVITVINLMTAVGSLKSWNEYCSRSYSKHVLNLQNQFKEKELVTQSRLST